MVDALGRAVAGDLVVLTQERWQLQCLQVVAEQDLWRVGHGVTAVRSSMYDRAAVIATVALGRYG